MSNKMYNLLKITGSEIIPALVTFYGIVGAACHIPYTPVVLTIGTGFATCWNKVINSISKVYFRNMHITEGVPKTESED